VIEIEVEGLHDGGSKIIQRLATLDLDVPAHLGPELDAEDVGS
jgi:hypothetical protein